MTPSPSEPQTEAGRDYVALAPDNGTREARYYIVRAIEVEARADAYASVLRGLRSEDDTLQLRAIIASVEADLAILAGTER